MFSRLILQPLAKWYLRKERAWSYKGIRVLVPSGVFHPGLFFSTGFLLAALSRENLRDKKLLELGAGSGLISLFALSRGAQVLATDINPKAIDGMSTSLSLNAGISNKKDAMQLMQSDLFAEIPVQNFDYIVVNPPYFPKDPQNDAEKAWYCGAHFEYFQNFFRQLTEFKTANNQVWMVLSEKCELEKIRSLAARHSFRLEEKSSKRIWWERNFIFWVKANR